jgi:hypothetical protein
MPAFNDFLLNLLSASLETAGESKLIEILQKLHDKDADQYNAAVFGGHALVKALLPIVTDSKTKIDDAIIKALDEAINQSSAANGVTFPE